MTTLNGRATQRGRQPATRDNSRLVSSSWAEKAGEDCRFRVRAARAEDHWGKMDDKLILAVFNCPELYNVTLPNYRCTESRANAWRNISMILGITSEECKRKWKNMRDRYLKEVRMENKSKKQGEIFQSRWKYRQLMNFIAPFAGSRSGGPDIAGNDDDHDNLDNESSSPGGEPAPSEVVKTSQSIVKSASQQDIKPQVAFVTQNPLVHQDAQITQLAKIQPGSLSINKAGRKRRLMPDSHSLNSSQSSPTKWLVKDNGSTFPNRPRDEDELFLLSFVPALKRLAPQKRCETKMKIQQIMYEAEFNVTQPQEKQVETEETQE